MVFSDSIKTLPVPLRRIILCFVIALGFGYSAGYQFLDRTTNFSSKGIETNYLGNENDGEAEELKFKKSNKEILSIIHSHVISMAIIFFLLGSILYCTGVNSTLKSFLMIEPFISLIVTFGGVWLLSNGILWMKYIVMLSGMLMTFSVFVMLLLIGFECVQHDRKK